MKFLFLDNDDFTQVDDNYDDSSGLEDKCQENCKQSGSERMAKITKKVRGKELVQLVILVSIPKSKKS